MQVYPVGRDVCRFFRKINGKELSYKQFLEIKNMQLHRVFDTLWRIKESSPDTKMILQHNPNGFGENTEPTIERVVTYQEKIMFEIRSHVYQLILARAYEWEQNAKSIQYHNAFYFLQSWGIWANRRVIDLILPSLTCATRVLTWVVFYCSFSQK